MTDGTLPKESGDYKVGYGSPPAHSRFKPGQCGNPKGRPVKPRPTESQILDRVLLEESTVQLGRKMVRMSRYEIMLRQLVKLAMGGDIKAIKAIAALGAKPIGRRSQLPQTVKDLSDSDLKRMIFMIADAKKRKLRSER